MTWVARLRVRFWLRAVTVAERQVRRAYDRLVDRENR